MSISLHHSQKNSQLPSLHPVPKKSPLNGKNRNQISLITKQKPSLRNLFQTQSETKISQSMSNILKNNSQIFNSIKKPGSDLKKCLHIPERYLVKNKKYYRVDAQVRTKQNLIKNDIQNIIQGIVQQKQKNEFLVLNLRKEFDCKKKSSQLKLNKQNHILQNRSSFNKIYHDVSECPIDSVNQFKQQVVRKKPHSSNQVLNSNQNYFFVKDNALKLQISNFKKTLAYYIRKLSNQSSKQAQKIESRISIGNIIKRNNFFKEYIKLSEQSYDFLEYYLKANYITQFVEKPTHFSQNQMKINSFDKNQIERILKNLDKKVIFSVLRNSQQSLQSPFNPQEMINRILLSLNLNPLNEFQFIKQETFTLLKKLIQGQNSKKQGRNFLLKYFLLDNKQISTEQFFMLIHSILKKLKPLINLSTIQALFDKFKQIFNQLQKQSWESIPQQQKQKQVNQEAQINIRKQNMLQKNKVKCIFANDPLLLWDSILQLIFLV